MAAPWLFIVQTVRVAECTNLSLPRGDVDAFVWAAWLHDVGKTSTYHLTALNVAEYEGHRVAAQKALLAPLRLFESVRLGPGTESAIRAMYERFDGQGFPEGTAGKEIPLGARLLAIMGTFDGLTPSSSVRPAEVRST